MKKALVKTLKTIIILYVIICILLFFFQEKLIFFPQKLDTNYKFHFDQQFEEMNIVAADGVLLNSLLFRADSSKGVILYLHGNGGSLASWGNVAGHYTDLGYDVLMLDYRGFGKSDGSVKSQEQIYTDVQAAYNELKKSYPEDKIVLLGYSLGSGLAARIASTNKPKLLILQAPYYSLTDVMRHRYPIIPTFILKYKFATNEHLKKCTMPVVIFHGDRDEVIYYGSSLKLQKHFKVQDTLITLIGEQHNHITENSQYQMAIRDILNR